MGQRGAAPHAQRQIRVGDEVAAEANRIGVARGDQAGRRVRGMATGRDQHIGPIGPEQGGALRLLAGQNRGVAEVVEAMARMAFGKSKRLHLAIEWIDAEDMAKMVLAWYRHGRCNPCGGRGYQVIEGTARLGNQCPACHGSGKRNFDDEFALERIELARWLLCELEREIPKGASAAMSLLASELRF